MISPAAQPRLREAVHHLQMSVRVLASFLIDALVLAGCCALLAAAWLGGPVALPPRDGEGWLLLLVGVLLAVSAVVVAARYLWWDLGTVATRLRPRTGPRRGSATTHGGRQEAATTGAAGALAPPALRARARSRDTLPLERPLGQAARVLAARMGLLAAVVLANLLLFAALLLFLRLGQLIAANAGLAVLAAATLVLLAVIARELRAMRRALATDIREAEALLVRQVPDLQQAQLRLLGEIKAEGRRLVEAREHLAALDTPHARLLAERVGVAAAAIADVPGEIRRVVGEAQETARAYERRAQEANRVAQALVAAMADHVSNFDRAASALTDAAQQMTATTEAGRGHRTAGIAGNGRGVNWPAAPGRSNGRAPAPRGPLPAAAVEQAWETTTLPEQVTLRHDLGRVLARRYQQGGALQLASEAVQQFERALAICPDRSSGRARIGHDLATLYRTMYERTGDDQYAQAAQKVLSDLLEQA